MYILGTGIRQDEPTPKTVCQTPVAQVVLSIPGPCWERHFSPFNLRLLLSTVTNLKVLSSFCTCTECVRIHVPTCTPVYMPV